MLIPYPYQQEAIDIGVQRNLLCADKCGLGKTLVGIEIARIVQQSNPYPVLVVCTKGARLQWSYAILEQLSNGLSNGRTHILDNVDDYDYAGSGTQSLDWFIIHYAALRKVIKKRLIARTYFSTIVADEVHRIKTKSSQQTKGLKRLLSHRKIGLSATPMEKSPSELWSVLNWMYPEKFRAYQGFRARYVQIEKHPWFGYEQEVGPKNADKLAQKIANIFIQRTKEDVRPDLPPLTETRVPLMLSDQVRGAYDAVNTADDILVTVEDEELLIANTLAKIMKLRQLLSNGWNKFTSDKLEYAKAYVRDNPDEGVAIFSVFRDTAIRISRDLKVPLMIAGEEYDVQKNRPQVIVGTIKKLGESHDMPWLDTALFVDCEWSTILMEQARDRIHRINITTGKQALYLYHPGTVDELVFDALDKKWSNIQIVQEYIRRYA